MNSLATPTTRTAPPTNSGQPLARANTLARPEALSAAEWDLIAWIPHLAQRGHDYSDIHLRIGQKPYLRFCGELAPLVSDVVPFVTQEMMNALMKAMHANDWVDRLKLEPRLAIAGEIGGFRFRVQGTREISHLDPMGTPSPSLTLRRLPTRIKTLAELTVPRAVMRTIATGAGLALVVGETGSGKSSTLAAILQEFNLRSPVHIATIEDPVEYIHTPEKALFTRKEIGKSTDGFAPALKDTLREDPDIILLGEIRDQETMRVALTAAETGHLVLGTLHASGAVQSIERILNFFPTHEHEATARTLATTLRSVLAQRLIPSINNSSRVLAYELMGVSKPIAQLIRERKLEQMPSAITNPGQGADRETLVLLNDQLFELTRQDKISAAHALRATYDGEDLRERFRASAIPYGRDFDELW